MIPSATSLSRIISLRKAVHLASSNSRLTRCNQFPIIAPGVLRANNWLSCQSIRFVSQLTLEIKAERRFSPPFAHLMMHSVRYFSSRGRGGAGSREKTGFQLDALSFSVTPEEALQKFQKWSHDEQGLKYLLWWSSVRIGASYVPVWSFDVNMRFVTIDPNTKRKRYDVKPAPFDFYKYNVVHLPGLCAYAGHTYRRSLIHPVHSTSLVFLGQKTVPFATWMLRDVTMSNGQRLEVFPDPWNATKGRAFAIVQEEINAFAQEDAERVGEGCKTQTEILSSRRVYMPTYVIDYSIFGVQYQAFVSGCDAGAPVSGVSHGVFSFSTDYSEQQQAMSRSLWSQVTGAVQVGRRALGDRFIGMVLINALSFLARVLMRIPLIGAVAGLFVGFRKVIQPWMDNRWASADWERQREHEAMMQDTWDHQDDFVDSGNAQKYFRQNRSQILRHLSGEHAHDQGSTEWYEQWTEWARHQWEQQQNQQQQQEYQRQQQGRQQKSRSRAQRSESKAEYKWDFDPNDPYAVLGIRRGASKTEVSQAFRREMLKYHPDMQTGANKAEKDRAVERSKLITEAYRKIKTTLK